MADNNDILDRVRRFAGADPAAEDTVLEMCYRAAVAWYEAAGVPENQENDLWVFWVCNLAAWMYDNRGNAEANAAIPVYIVTSVHQLRPQGAFRSPPSTPSAPAEGTEAANGSGTQTGTGSTGTGTGSQSAGTESAGGDA